MLGSFRGYICITRVQKRTSTLTAKPNQANTDFFFCKPEFSLQWQNKYICTCFVHSAALWILIFMVFFYSHRVFRTTQNEVNPQFSGQPLLHFVSHIKMLENLETLHTLVLNAACWVSQGFFAVDGGDDECGLLFFLSKRQAA